MMSPDDDVVILPPLASGPDEIAALGLAKAGIDQYETVFFPGQGDTATRPGATFADQAHEVIRRAGSRNVHVIALAIGAYAAAELVLRHSDRIASLVVVSSSPGPVADDARARDRDRASEADQGMAALVEGTLARWFTPAAIRADAPGVRTIRRRLTHMDPRAWHDLWVAIAGRRGLDASSSGAFDVPVTIVVPLGDQAAGASLPPLHDWFPRSRLLYVDGPHMVGLERPETLIAAIDSHFAWLGDGGQRRATPIYVDGGAFA